ncbi:hypothetical protein [Thermoflavimicrobium daqui]|uniref:Uncharacterized protein n=1 Tax=Thermoflavimicrobium daqui TaxID=2137476 RepID=A0A364K1L7_9BACL|nr:hypothetical protein [Thermoflavimicrobium daqui]RAL21483.1 hypothetical protein DL897_16130 [Thermoflavimicrobium daqui]
MKKIFENKLYNLLENLVLIYMALHLLNKYVIHSPIWSSDQVLNYCIIFIIMSEISEYFVYKQDEKEKPMSQDK